MMEVIGVSELDLIMIDGWHSVNMCINDWQYTEKLSATGVVVLHDINFHPGPVVLFDAIADNLFEKEKFGVGEADWGIATAIRI